MRRSIAFMLIYALLTAACNAAPAAAPTVAPTAAQTSGPAWLRVPFTDARTGKPITLADYSGKTVYVEAMAAWCTNCLAQQKQVVDARKAFGDNVVFISLDVDPSEDSAKLAQYATDQGFGWTFALAGKDLSAQLITQFGRTITNPSSTPKFVISPNGKVSDLVTGGESVNDLIQRIKQQSAL